MELYEVGDATIWTDPYIQRQLLAAHLNPDTDAATRRPSTIAATVDWILNGRQHPGHMVDLGCGPGLYAEIFAARKWDVLGVDLNTTSLDYARQSSRSKGLEIRYIEHSYLDIFGEERFDLAICIYCDFGALTREQQGVFLNNAARLLVSGGMLVLDVFGPQIASRRREGRSWTHENGNGFWCAAPCHILSECRHFADEAVWGQKYVVIPDGQSPKTYVLWDHYFTAETIARRLTEYGFQIVEMETNIVPQNDFASTDVLFVKATTN